MKSTALIHEIIDEFGSDDNRGLYKALKALRLQVKSEVIGTIRNASRLVTVLYEKD